MLTMLPKVPPPKFMMFPAIPQGYHACSQMLIAYELEIHVNPIMYAHIITSVIWQIGPKNYRIKAVWL